MYFTLNAKPEIQILNGLYYAFLYLYYSRCISVWYFIVFFQSLMML